MSNNRGQLNRNARQTNLARVSLVIKDNDQVWRIVKQPNLTAQEIEAVANFYDQNIGMRNALQATDALKNSIFHYIAANAIAKEDQRMRFAVTQLLDIPFTFNPATVKNAKYQTVEDLAWDKLNNEVLQGIQASSSYQKAQKKSDSPSSSSVSSTKSAASSASSSSYSAITEPVPEDIWRIFKGGIGDLKRDTDRIVDYLSDNPKMINAQDPETGNTILHFLAKQSALNVFSDMMGESRAEKYLVLAASLSTKYKPDGMITNLAGETYSAIEAANQKKLIDDVVQKFPQLLTQRDLTIYQVDLLKKAIQADPGVVNRKNENGDTPAHVLLNNKKMDDLLVGDIARDMTLQSFRHRDATTGNVFNPSLLNGSNESVITAALDNDRMSFLTGVQDATQELLKKPGDLSKILLDEVKKLNMKVESALEISKIEEKNPEAIDKLGEIVRQIKNGNETGKANFTKDTVAFFQKYPSLLNYQVGPQGNVMHYLSHFAASDNNAAKVCNQFESLLFKLSAISLDPNAVNNKRMTPGQVSNEQAKVAAKLLGTAKDNFTSLDDAVKKVADYDFKQLFEMSHVNNAKVRDVKKVACEFLMHHKGLEGNKLYASVARELNVIQPSSGLFSSRPKSVVLPSPNAAPSSKEVSSDRGPATPGKKG